MEDGFQVSDSECYEKEAYKSNYHDRITENFDEAKNQNPVWPKYSVFFFVDLDHFEPWSDLDDANVLCNFDVSDSNADKSWL